MAVGMVNPVVGSVRSIALDGVAALDTLVFEAEDWWSAPARVQADLRLGLVRQSVQHHLDYNPDYQRFAEVCGFDLDQLGDVSGLARVPQLPTTVFKLRDVRTGPITDCSIFTSSGTTTGVRSRVWRDDTSLQRLAGSLNPEAGIWGDTWGDADLDEDGVTLHLGPPRAQAQGVWISYVMSLIELFTTVRHHVQDGVLHLDRAVEELRTNLAAGKFVAVVGPPVFVTELLRQLARTGERLSAGERAAVVTGGGWKRTEAQRIDPVELRALAVDTLGLSSATQVRDVFNQVELNSAFVECEHHRKHVPPWVHVIVRDPQGLSPLPDGETGLLTYLDPSASSYPCFLVAEDFGRVEVDRCPCGRYGTTVDVLRRLTASTHQGCALRLATSTTLR